MRATGVFALSLLATACSQSTSTSDVSATTLSAAVSVIAPAADAAATDAGAAVTSPPPGYRLVWSDDFNSDGLPRRGKWSYDTDFNAQGWNGQAQYYSAGRGENARVEDGHLIIEARHERIYHVSDNGGQVYTSARLTTRDKARWTYGFFDVRARIPCGQGVRPAIWMIGGSQDETGEIDLMEHTVANATTISGTLHSEHTEATGVHQGDQAPVPDLCSAFHDYQAEWTTDRITLMVDGRPYYHLDRQPGAGPAQWPFRSPHYLILNISVTEDADPAAFPARMEVDYVRIYQK